MKLKRRLFLLFPSLSPAFVKDVALSCSPANAPGPCVRNFIITPYPNIARKIFMQGDVTAKVHVLGNGIVDSVVASGGHKPLQESVEWAVKQWEFLVSDERDSDLNIAFSFLLDENEAEACIFQVSGSLPSRVEIRINYGPHMK